MIIIPKKKSLDDVKKFLYENTNGSVKVLSTEYINTKTPMIFECSCGNQFVRSFDKLHRSFYCKECVKNNIRDKFKKPIDDVISTIEKHGCEYIDGEYTNNASLLTLRCRCGNIFKKSFRKFTTGQDRCPECGKRMSAEAKIKYTPLDAKMILQQHGYYINEKDYVNAYTPTPCKCTRNHNCNIILSQLLVGRSGCKLCAIENNKVVLNNFYKDGGSKASDAIRFGLRHWIKEVENSYNNICPITGSSDVVVHHLISLNMIVESICEKYNEYITYNKKINEFKDFEIFDRIRDSVIFAHSLKMGILIDRKLHINFHKEYGYGYNTPNQFDNYLQKYYNITLDSVLMH